MRKREKYCTNSSYTIAGTFLSHNEELGCIFTIYAKKELKREYEKNEVKQDHIRKGP